MDIVVVVLNMANLSVNPSLQTFEPFDPTLHTGNELKSFEQWLRRFDNRYSLISKLPADATALQISTETKKHLLDVSLDSVLDTFESLYETYELFKAAGYDDLIQKYKERLKPNQTITLLRHRFHNIVQENDELFDTFVNRVKREVVYCDYHCATDRTSI